MEKKEDEKNQMLIDSSFDEEDIKKLNNNIKNKSNHCFNFDAEKEKNLNYKYFEENDINEIFDVLNEMNQAVTIDTDSINKKEFIGHDKKEYNDENTNIMFNDEHFNACQEILSILKKPSSNKTIIRNRNIYNSQNDTPFKPLLKPKKVSLVGKVFYDIPSDINSTCSSKNNNNINIENNNHS